MRIVFGLLLVVACSVAVADSPVVIVNVTTAQDDANEIARTEIFRHRGRNGGCFEGIGMSSVSADHAIRSCCFWSQRKPRDIGVSRSRRGVWYAVVRYW